MLTDDILQLHPFQVVPDPLIGVQLGGVGWQLLQMDSLTSRAGQKGFDLLAPVDGTAIPDDQQAHRDVSGQVPQETGRIPTTEGPVLYLGVQPAMGGDAADHRQMVPAERGPEKRGLAPGGIGPYHQGQQVTAGLVYEDDGSAFVPGLFFRAGQRSSFQRWMASSSRWLARFRGFWRLQLYCLRMRPTWEGWYWTPKWRRMTWVTLGWVNLDLRPGGLRWCRAWGPSALARLSHWLTAPLDTPRASAMRCWCHPSWNSSQARRRRPSRQLVAC